MRIAIVPQIRFISLNHPQIQHVTDQKDFLIGRTEDCAIRIKDFEVSRRTARVQFQNDGYTIKNLGQNPILINDRPITEHTLNNGDHIQLGASLFKVRITKSDPPITAVPGPLSETPSASIPSQSTESGPRLEFESTSGQVKRFPLLKDRILIGRSQQADIRLPDESVSRKHFAILKEGERHLAAKMSRTSPLLINDQDTDRQRLFSGDRIQVGPYNLKFMSDHAPAAGTIEEKAPPIIPAAEQAVMGPHLMLDPMKGGTQSFLLDRDQVLIGRDVEADIHLDEQNISRRHCIVRRQPDGYVIEKMSRVSPLLVNGVEVAQARLYTGDQIQVGPHFLVFVSDRAVDAKPADLPDEDRTIMYAEPADMPDDDRTIFDAELLHHEVGARLVADDPSGRTESFPLLKKRTMVGRSAEADVHLDDPSVSRNHCAVERGEDGYYAIRLSSVSPVLVNHEEIERRRLYTGDQIQLGAKVLSFLSDSPEDAWDFAETVIIKKSGPPLAVWLASICLILIMGGYLGHQHAYVPWKAENTIKTAARTFDAGQYDAGKEMLEDLLKTNLPLKAAGRARKLLADTTLNYVEEVIKGGDFDHAAQVLVSFLQNHGTTAEADLIWRKLDHVRYSAGGRLESEGKPLEAIREYAAVRAVSPLFDKASKASGRLWLSFQLRQLIARHQQKIVTGLLEEARKNFKMYRFLTPAGNSAYAIYQAVLTLDADNTAAREKIVMIKSYYLDSGNDFLADKKWAKALESYENYALIDPLNPDINEKINICRKKLAAARAVTFGSSRKRSAVVKQLALQQQRLERNHKQQTVSTLLKSADEHFKRQKYLAPLNSNAYALYQGVLAIDADNRNAREQVQHIESRFRQQGVRFFNEGNWHKARLLLNGYTLIDPNDVEVREKLITCEQKLFSAGSHDREKLAQSLNAPSWVTPYIFEKK